MEKLREPVVFYPLLLVVECLYMWALSGKLELMSLSLDYMIAVSYWLVQVLCLATLGELMSIRNGKVSLLKKCVFAMTVFLSSRYVAVDALASDDRYVRSFEAYYKVSAVSFPDFPVRELVFAVLVLISFVYLSDAVDGSEAPQ